MTNFIEEQQMNKKVEQLIKDLDGYQHLESDQYSSGWNAAIEQITELLKEIVWKQQNYRL